MIIEVVATNTSSTAVFYIGFGKVQGAPPLPVSKTWGEATFSKKILRYTAKNAVFAIWRVFYRFFASFWSFLAVLGSLEPGRRHETQVLMSS